MMTTPSRYSLSPCSRLSSVPKRVGLVGDLSGSQSPIQRDYLDSSVPRFRNVSPCSGSVSERRFQIKASKTFAPSASDTPAASSANVQSCRGKRDRSKISVPSKEQEVQPTSGGRWVLSALRCLPLVGSLVGSQEDDSEGKQEHDNVDPKHKQNTLAGSDHGHNSSSKSLGEDGTDYALLSGQQVSPCKVTASPSFRSLVSRSSLPNKETQPFLSTSSHGSHHPTDIPVPCANEFYQSHTTLQPIPPDTALQSRFVREDPDGSTSATTHLSGDHDLRRLFEMRRQYGFDSLPLYEAGEHPSEELQGKKQKRSCLIQDLPPVSTKSASWDLFSSAVPLPMGRSEHFYANWQTNDITSHKPSSAASFQDTHTLASATAIRKKRGLRAVDYRRLLQQAKFQPCHWIDYFDYVKAKTADEEDQRHYTGKGEKSTVRKSEKSLTDRLSLPHSTTPLNSFSDRNFSKEMNDQPGRNGPPSDPPSQLSTVCDKKSQASLGSLEDQHKSSQVTSMYSPITQDAPTKKRSLSSSMTMAPHQEFSSLFSGVKFNKEKQNNGLGETTSVSDSKEKEVHTDQSGVAWGTASVKGEKDHGQETTCAVKESTPTTCAPLPWWKENLTKNVEIPLEDTGVFADNADDEAKQASSQVTVNPSNPGHGLSTVDSGDTSQMFFGGLLFSQDKDSKDQTVSNSEQLNSFKPSLDSMSSGTKTFSSLFAPSSNQPISESALHTTSQANDNTSLVSKPDADKEEHKSSPGELKQSSAPQVDTFKAPELQWTVQQKPQTPPCAAPPATTDATAVTLSNHPVAQVAPTSTGTETSGAVVEPSGVAASSKPPSIFGTSFTPLFTSKPPLSSSPLTFGQNTTSQLSGGLFGAPSSSTQVPNSITETSQPATSLFGNLTNPPTGKAFVGSAPAQDTSSSNPPTGGKLNLATSNAPMPSPFSMTPNLFENSTLGNSTSLFAAPSTSPFLTRSVESEEQPSKRGAATPASLFGGMLNPSSETTQNPSGQLFDNTPQTLFSFGSTTTSTGTNPGVALRTPGSNPFAANAASFPSASGPRRPKIRLKRTLH